MRLLAPVLSSLVLIVLIGCERTENITTSEFNETKWAAALEKPNLTKEEFARLYAQALATRCTNGEVKLVGGRELMVRHSDGSTSRIFLDNAWNDAQADPASRPEVVRGYLNALFTAQGYDRSSVRSLDTNNVVAVLRDDLFLKQAARTGPKSTNRIVFEPWVADLKVVYAVDREGAIQYLTEADRQKLSLALPGLRALALTNLKRILPEINRHGGGPVFMLVADGNYESSLLLADTLWDEQAKVVQGDIVVGVPARDALIFTGAGSAEGLRSLRKAVDQIHSQGSHLISKTLLVRRNGQWQKFSD